MLCAWNSGYFRLVTPISRRSFYPLLNSTNEDDTTSLTSDTVKIEGGSGSDYLNGKPVPQLGPVALTDFHRQHGNRTSVESSYRKADFLGPAALSKNI